MVETGGWILPFLGGFNVHGLVLRGTLRAGGPDAFRPPGAILHVVCHDEVQLQKRSSSFMTLLLI